MLLVEHKGEARRSNLQQIALGRDRKLRAGCILEHKLRRVERQTELFLRNVGTRRDAWLLLDRRDKEIDEVLRVCLRLQSLQGWDDQLAAFLRSNIQGELLAADDFIARHHRVRYHVLLDIGKVETVFHQKLAGRGIEHLEGYVLVGIFNFRHRGMGRAVGIDDSVAEEIAVARGIHAIVAAVSIVFHPMLVFLQETLVHPVPDETALKVRILVNRLPLVVEATRRVSHRVGILRRNDGTVASLAPNLLKPVGIGILGNIHIGIPLPEGTLVIDRTVHAALFLILYIKVSLVEVVPVPGFIAQGENRNARIVFVPLVHILGTVEMRTEPFGVVAQGATLFQIIIHAVRFDIRLVIDIQAVFVAEGIELAVLRIMGEADSIDIIPLHRLEILAHQFFRNVMPRLGIMLVDIHALELNRLAIEKQHVVRATVGILLLSRCHLDATETDVEGNDFDCPLPVLHGQ